MSNINVYEDYMYICIYIDNVHNEMVEIGGHRWGV